MPRTGRKRATPVLRPTAGTAKYDAHHRVLGSTYGALAELRRELSDSRADVAEREELLKQLGGCADPQRAWLLLEDYFEKLSVARRDFPGEDWWPRMLASQGNARLEEVAHLFLRAKRTLPSELLPPANFERFARQEEAAEEQKLVVSLVHWLFPPAPVHLDAPRATVRTLCAPEALADQPGLSELVVRFHILRARTGERDKTPAEVIELTLRATQEEELFPREDWLFIKWLAENHRQRDQLG
ncbi:MAG TPA: ATP-dependent helicase, partial [Verrucomicrobiota bacterium]|nr:ATP-dependent helicase [Verrucomicrobiota bacterium]